MHLSEFDHAWQDLQYHSVKKDQFDSKILYKIEVVSKEEFNVYLNCGEKIMITGDGITAVPPNSMSME